MRRTKRFRDVLDAPDLDEVRDTLLGLCAALNVAWAMLGEAGWCEKGLATMDEAQARAIGWLSAGDVRP